MALINRFMIMVLPNATVRRRLRRLTTLVIDVKCPGNYSIKVLLLAISVMTNHSTVAIRPVNRNKAKKNKTTP